MKYESYFYLILFLTKMTTRINQSCGNEQNEAEKLRALALFESKV